MDMILWEGISHVLLDIEGTTCPVSYVTETLFPYASANLAPYLETHQHEANIRALIQELETLWQQDTDQAFEECCVAELQQGLVASHAARFACGQDDARDALR